MNAYYERTNIEAISGNRPANIQTGDRLISLICAIVAFFTSAIAIKVEKALLCTAGFIAFFGAIGSMESGSLGFLGGLAICAVVSLVEVLVFKSMIRSKRTSK